MDSGTEIGPCASRARRLSPSTNGMLYHGRLSTSPAVMTGTICACCSPAARAISRSNRAVFTPAANSGDSTLTTTFRWNRVSSARKTRDIPPPPSSRSMVCVPASAAWSLSRRSKGTREGTLGDPVCGRREDTVGSGECKSVSATRLEGAHPRQQPNLPLLERREVAEQLLMSRFVLSWCSRDERQRAADLQPTGLHFVKPVEPLAPRRGLQLGARNQFALEPRVVDLALLDENVRVALEPSCYHRVRVEITHHDPVDDEEGGRSDDAANEGVVIPDDRVLHRIRQQEKHDEVERIELAGLRVTVKAQAYQEKRVDRK